MRRELKTYEARCDACGKTERFESAEPQSWTGTGGLPAGWSAYHHEMVTVPSPAEAVDPRWYPKTLRWLFPDGIPPGTPAPEMSRTRVRQDLCGPCTALYDVPEPAPAEESSPCR